MGSYAECWLSGIFVGSSKNDVDPSLIDHFRPVDKRIVRDPKQPLPPELERWKELHEGGDEFVVVFYEIPTRFLRDRLAVWGYTLDSCRRAFERAVELKIEEVRKFAEKEREGESAALLKDHYQAELRVLGEMTPDGWLESIKKCAERREIPGHRTAFHEGPEEGTLFGYMLSQDDDWYGCPIPDHNIPLRLVLEEFPDGHLVYDLTDLVRSGYVDENEDFIDRGIRTAAEEYSYRAKTLVLTEGRSDSELLRESMAVLYPHLADYFSFMDFDVTKAEGGAARLAQLVKSFGAAGIVNRTIALFDNDSAAAVAMSSLSRSQLPRHIVVRKLPELDFLKSYPTVGPTGVARADVNGSAVSIELMLGQDVLRDPVTDDFLPVQWTGLERSLGRYQGEVSDKVLIQERFKEKLKRTRSDPSYLQGADWEGTRKVLSLLFTAFDDFQAANMLAFVESYFEEHVIW